MLSIFVSALNEEKNIGATIETLFRAAEAAGGIPIEILAVNDGSTDQTGDIIDAYGKRDPRVRPIHHEQNLGIGCGFKEAVAQARHPKFMIAPGDNDTPPEMLTDLMKCCDRADLILGYWLNREDRGRYRNIVSTLFNAAYMVSFNVFVQYLNGPTIYPTEKLRALTIRAERFSICAEVTIKLLRTGCTFSEISGYMRTGIEGSGSLQFRNLSEVISTFVMLLYEVHYSKRAEFRGRPQRVRL